MNQLNTLGEELSTGEAAQTYSDLGAQAGVAVALGAQLSNISGYSSTATTVGTSLTIAQSVLGQLGAASTAVQQAVSQQGQFALDNTGQTSIQESAASYLDEIVSLLNTQVGGNYIFSGSAVNQPSVASASTILNGTGTQAGLIQLTAQRQQADLGATGLGRLTVGGTGADVTLSADGFAIRLSACRRQFELDRCDGQRAVRLAAFDFGQSRIDQSESRRFNFVQPHLAGRFQPDHHAAGDHGFAAGRQPVHHRHDRRQPPPPICRLR